MLIRVLWGIPHEQKCKKNKNIVYGVAHLSDSIAMKQKFTYDVWS